MENLNEFKEQARQAYYWNSMSPNRRGDQFISSYTEVLNEDLSKIENATDDEKQRYVDGFKKRIGNWLNAKSKCASSMITGPANFPVEKNRRANDREHKVGQEFEEYREKAIKAILKKIDDRRPQEEKDDERWEKVKKGLIYDCSVIVGIDKGEQPYNRSLFVSSIAKRVETMAKNGEVELVKKCTKLIAEINGKYDKPIITNRHKFWKLEELAQQSRDRSEEMSSKEDKVYDYDGFQVVISYQDERIRIVHDEKPSRDVIDNIKKHGFRWSRFNTAWQRKLTNNAIYTTFKIMLKDVEPLKTAE